MATDVSFSILLNQGVGITGKQLGPEQISAGIDWYLVNSVELQFVIDPSIYNYYTDLKPIQWAGPDIVWARFGDPFLEQWQLMSQKYGSGADGPLQHTIYKGLAIIAYYDQPGPNITNSAFRRKIGPDFPYGNWPTRVFAIQNFTCWIVGSPITGGPAVRLCEVASWHSVTDFIGLPILGPFPSWGPMPGNRTGVGWVDTNILPP
jgi:hypothetical protein